MQRSDSLSAIYLLMNRKLERNLDICLDCPKPEAISIVHLNCSQVGADKNPQATQAVDIRFYGCAGAGAGAVAGLP